MPDGLLIRLVNHTLRDWLIVLGGIVIPLAIALALML
jgi:hypothetical protein